MTTPARPSGARRLAPDALENGDESAEQPALRARGAAGGGSAVSGEIPTSAACRCSGRCCAPRRRKKRPKREREAPEVGAFVRRQLLALVRRTAGGELEALVVLYRLRAFLDDQIAAAFLAADTTYDHPTIGGELGINKRAVQQRVARAREEQSDRRTA